MSEESQSNPANLIMEIMQMPEYNVRQKLMAFNNSLYIFSMNYEELNLALDFFTKNKDDGSLSAVKNRDKLAVVQDEVLRRLHNFVASAQSLIDHTRRFYQTMYEGDSLLPEYQERVNAEF